MTRTNPSSRSRKEIAQRETVQKQTVQNDAAVDFAPLDEFLQHQIRWFDQVAALQTTWLTSYLAVQADCWRMWATGTPQFPPWMVWQNGAEQIA